MENNLTVLIVEDNDDDVGLLKLAMTREGIENPVQVVADGQEAIDYLCGNGKFHDRIQYPFPQVIFTDLKMPRKDGFDVLDWLKKHPECGIIPVIILSASKQDADIKKAYQLGANAYLCKPVRIAQLQEMVRTAFQFWALCELPEAPAKCS